MCSNFKDSNDFIPGVVDVRGVLGVPGTSMESALNATIFNGAGWARLINPLIPFCTGLGIGSMEFVSFVSFVSFVAFESFESFGEFGSSVAVGWPLLFSSFPLSGFVVWLVLPFWSAFVSSPTLAIDRLRALGKFVSSIAAFNSLAVNSSIERFMFYVDVTTPLIYPIETETNAKDSQEFGLTFRKNFGVHKKEKLHNKKLNMFNTESGHYKRNERTRNTRNIWYKSEKSPRDVIDSKRTQWEWRKMGKM